nr:hypothetical protein [Tanacetum cinerariifolium]
MPVHIIVEDIRTMDMTIDQQVALDEALVPHSSRLRIGKSNFHLRLDITSKELTLQRAPHSPENVPRDHVPVFVPEFEHPEDLVPAEDEAPASLLPPEFLSPRTPPLLPIPLSTPSASRRAGIPEVDTPPRNRPLLATPRPGCETHEALARSEAYCRALEARVAVLETHARPLEWHRQATDDLVVQHIMRTQA